MSCGDLSSMPPVAPVPYRHGNDLLPVHYETVSILLGDLPLSALSPRGKAVPTSPERMLQGDNTLALPDEPVPALQAGMATGQTSVNNPATPRGVMTQPPVPPSTGRQRNPWVGKKRGCSPDRRTPKIARLGDSVSEDVKGLKDDLQSMREQRVEERNADRDREEERFATIRTEMVGPCKPATNLATQAKVAEIGALTGPAVREIVKSECSDTKSRLDSLSRAQESSTGVLDERLAQIGTSVQALGSAVARLEHALDCRAKAASQFDEWKSSFVKAPSSLGEQGYLTPHCPAPSTMDQKTYEAALIRAAVYYFSLFPPDVSGVF
ncbi:Uu.00g134050.m01.CDS01 [Anthostomella pinea]|uniref:Uu.00g134050.m01.CDS01 n=1 Tax=Anthostomella pinea TaxID=933095 RepID=A0AAI8VNV0_9PEZI|nr:Uu.00g134050.m01.CDS01 [Anthostomella pinea]